MPRPDRSKQKWIEKGYEHFGLYGPNNISINAISKEIGSPRASFYHYFSDMEVFSNILLEAHVDVIDSFIGLGKQECKRLIPDLYGLLERFPMGLKFQRQLFLNRHIPQFGYLFSKSHDQTINELILDLFFDEFDLNLKREDAARLWLTLTESWYARIDPENLVADELQRIAEDIMTSILKFMDSDLFIKMS